VDVGEAGVVGLAALGGDEAERRLGGVEAAEFEEDLAFADGGGGAACGSIVVSVEKVSARARAFSSRCFSR